MMRFRLRRFSMIISAVALMGVTLVVSHLDYSAALGGSPGRVTLRVSVETSLEDARRDLAETGEALTRQDLFDVADLQALQRGTHVTDEELEEQDEDPEEKEGEDEQEQLLATASEDEDLASAQEGRFEGAQKQPLIAEGQQQQQQPLSLAIARDPEQQLAVVQQDGPLLAEGQEQLPAAAQKEPAAGVQEQQLGLPFALGDPEQPVAMAQQEAGPGAAQDGQDHQEQHLQQAGVAAAQGQVNVGGAQPELLLEASGQEEHQQWQTAPEMAAQAWQGQPQPHEPLKASDAHSGSSAGGPRMLLRYTACTGLINQFYAHLAAFLLAAVLPADVVIPPALCRDSFQHYFSTRREQNEVAWSPAPPGTLLDVAGIQAAWARRGIRVLQAPDPAVLPDLAAPQVAFPAYTQQGVDPRLVARLEGLYLKPHDLENLAARARQATAGVVAAVQREEPGVSPPLVVLDLPCTMFAVRANSSLPLVSEVAQSLEFSPYMQSLADRIVDRITESGRLPFNGAHLRLEKDARDWKRIMRGPGVYWQLHIEAMQAAAFDNTTQLYVACGLLSYGANVDWNRTVNGIKGKGLASVVRSKEEYIAPEELAGLNSEQKALLDLLVLARAQRFVGFGASSFSFFLREYRALRHGLPKASAVLVDASRVGTNAMFAQAAVLTATGT